MSEWWAHPRKISIVVDTPGWFDPFAGELEIAIRALGDQVNILRNCVDIDERDVVFYLSCTKKVPAEILRRAKASLVVHASDLPAGRGFSPVVWQVLEGRNRIPISLIFADEQVDSGCILLKDHIDLEGHELNNEIRTLLGTKVNEMCLRYLNSPTPPQGQPQAGESSQYRRRHPKDSALDVNRTIAEQFNLLRVVDNERYPAFFDFHGVRYILKIEKAVDEGRG